MSSERIMKELEKKGIKLWAEDGALHYKKSTGKLNDSEKEVLIKYKLELLDYLDKKADAGEPFPLTDIQMAYLLGRNPSFEYGNVSCHIYLELAYKSLDADKAEKAWNRLIQRHDMLRAVILPEGVQKVLPEVPWLKIFYKRVEKEERDDLRSNWGNKTYDTGKWPLFDIGVTEAEKDSVLHLSFDFLIADWTSIWQLLREFETLYKGEQELGERPEVSFKEYLLKENDKRFGSIYAEDKKYWMDRILTLPPAPVLPVKEKTEMKNSFQRLTYKLDYTSWNTLKSQSVTHGVTPTAAVLSVFALCVERWSENKKFCLNLTMLNRDSSYPHIYEVVGDFTSVNLLEVDLTTAKRFSETAREINKQLFQDLDHRSFSGVEVLREIRRNNSDAELIFPIIFTSSIGLINMEKMDGTITDRGISQTPQAFLDCQVMDNAEGLYINWDIRDGVFEDGVVEAMFSAFTNALISLSKENERWSGKNIVNMLASQINLRKQINNTCIDIKPATLHEMFLDSLQKYPDRAAVADESGTMTYKELGDYALDIASELKNKGFKRGELAAIKADKGARQIAAALGVLYLGGSFVPVDNSQPIQRVRSILDSAKISYLIGDSQDPDLTGIPVTVIDISYRNKEKKDLDIVKENVDDIAYVIFTSGSTGTPKGVAIQHKAAHNTIFDINERFQVGDMDRILGLSQLHFDLAIYDIFGILSKGGMVVYPYRERYKDPSHWAELIEKWEITIWNSVPAFMKMLLNYLEVENKKDSKALRTILLSGDWIPVDMPDKLREFIPASKIIALGGATEASIWSNYHECKENEHYKRSIPYGVPLANQGFYILDPKNQDCPDLVRGEIYITGAGLAAEYVGDKEKTEVSFLYHPADGKRMYRTGDYGRYLPNGEIEFMGRKDNQVKIAGHRIELGEIEKALKKNPKINEACAVVADGEEGNKIIAAVVTNEITRDNTKETTGIMNGEVPNSITQYDNDTYSEIELKIDTVPMETLKLAFSLRDNIAFVSMLQIFRQAGIFTESKEYSFNFIKSQLQAQSTYNWIIKYWLNHLVLKGIIQKTKNGAYLYNSVLEGYNMEEAMAQLKHLWEDGLGTDSFMEYYEICVKNLYEVLTGKINPVDLLYPEGSTRVLESLYQENVVANYFNAALSKAVIETAKRGKEPVKILEIGAGSGATAIPVIDGLKAEDINRFEYYFTDVSKSFFAKARENLKQEDTVIFKIFDMNEEYRPQGFRSNEFDIIIAAGVLENAKDIKKTLNYIRELAKPEGVLLFTEPIKEEPWILVSQIFMMTEPEDDTRDNSLYLNEEQWEELLSMDGKYENIAMVPSHNEYNMRLFIKKFSKGKLWVQEEELKNHLKEYLPEYMIPSQIQMVDSLPLNTNGKIDRNQIKEWLVKMENSLSREQEGLVQNSEIGKIVSELLMGTLGVSEVKISDNLYELGADSLIMAQIAGKLKEILEEKEGVQPVTFDELLRQLLNYPNVKNLLEYLEPKLERVENSQNILQSNAAVQYYGKDNSGVLKVMFHAGLGTVNCYQYMIPQIKKQASERLMTISIKNSETYCSIPTENLIDSIADDYAKQIKETGYKKVQLLGYCLGGIIALEVGKRLMEQGIEVSDLSIIDSYPALHQVEEDIFWEAIYLPNFLVSIPQVTGRIRDDDLIDAINYIRERNCGNIPKGSLSQLQENQNYRQAADTLMELTQMSVRERFIKYAAAVEKSLEQEVTAQMLESVFQVYKHSFMGAKLKTHYYSGNVRFFAAKEKQNFLFADMSENLKYWDEICIGEFEIIETPGNHITCIWDKENAVHLVNRILNYGKAV